MATPHVAGCVALLCCDFQCLTPSQAAGKLTDTLQKPSGWNTKYGPGVVDMPTTSPAGLYALLYSDGELVFQNSRTPASGKTPLGTYPISAAAGGSSEYAGWYDQRAKITKATFAETVKPGSTALWFYDCSNLTAINGLEKLDTSGVTNMSQMFKQCTKLSSLDLSSLNTGSVKDMPQMFMDCTSLTTLNLRKWNTESLTAMQDMFKGYSKLTTIWADESFTVSKVPSGTSVFEGCTSLVGQDKRINFCNSSR